MVDHVLVEWSRGGDEDRHSRSRCGARPGLDAARRRDRARVAGQDRRIEPADVHVLAPGRSWQRPRGSPRPAGHARSPPLRWQVAAPAGGPAPWAKPFPERLAQPGQQASTAVRARPNMIVWRPAGRNGSAQRLASVWAEPRAPVEASMIGGSTSRACRSPVGVRLMSRDAPGHSPPAPTGSDRRRAADDDRRAADGRTGGAVGDDVRDVAAVDAAVRCSSSMTMTLSCSNSWNHFVWWGRIPEFSMSGFRDHETTWPALRRRTGSVPGCRRRRWPRPWTSGGPRQVGRISATWSWLSAFLVGNRNSARDSGSSAMAWRTAARSRALPTRSA